LNEESNDAAAKHLVLITPLDVHRHTTRHNTIKCYPVVTNLIVVTLSTYQYSLGELSQKMNELTDDLSPFENLNVKKY